MDAFKLAMEHKCGVGGWRCPCCGPRRQDRPLYRRAARRRLRQQDSSLLHDIHDTGVLHQTQDTLARVGTRLLREHAHLYDEWNRHQVLLADLRRRGYELVEVHDDIWLAINANLATDEHEAAGRERAALAVPPFITIVGHVGFTTEWAAASD